ncbi:hypothetical protein SODALDRAFT_329702 [Sodiomyces alkalinus F11]|uniref:Corticosteroid-binding protein n=1 Tax=Sodiomyces alkalinus (strain CBS 110278 / VKM F-3762 / F11) TaxID=1314773 RepID=A0A3N2PJ82_SODAK|nr:hypothetical protein SODALDRAFT_329702 [Sodiomyces alkalinus F11]ROT34592.1 hypothetical protein SODALDRAFT_329702 [Sodiomyces alkalinus F11]
MPFRFSIPRALRRPPIHTISIHPLLVPLPLLSLLTLVALTILPGVEIPMLYSQCHARARLPSVSWIPALGAPLCFILSFFHEALAAVRSRATLAVILAYLAAMLTVSLVEAARVASRPNWLLRRVLLLWLVLELVGGAIVWQLLIVGSFLLQTGREVSRHRNAQKALVTPPAEHREEGGEGADARAEARAEAREAAASAEDAATPTTLTREAIRRRRLETDSDALAIPIAVELGFVLPAIIMFIYHTPATIGLWLLFPVIVSVVRRAVRGIVAAIISLRRRRRRRTRADATGEPSSSSRPSTRPRALDLEANRLGLALVYALPVLLSLLAHVFWIWSLTRRDDRKQMTRAVVDFLQLDAAFMLITSLYWLFVETGWKLFLYVVASSVVLGPGAGLCIGWILREKAIRAGFDEDAALVRQRGREGSLQGEEGQDRQVTGHDEPAGEETPLLRSS